jgi:hypothetical protein
MSEDRPPDGQRESLTDRIDGRIRRFLQYEKRLEELMQWMGWIRQSKVPQHVGDEQVAEFVIQIRRRYGMIRQQ